MITRFSTRRARLDTGFLTARLTGARSYDRIAGFLPSSIIEVAGKALETMAGPVRMICNSVPDLRDVLIAQKVAQTAMRRE